MNNIVKLLISVAVSFTAAFGSLTVGDAFTKWYPSLNKPVFTPPGWIFGPVWTILYLMMGIALYLVWRDGVKRDIRVAVPIFIIQLVLNALWSFIFFGLKAPGAALVEIVVLWMAIVLTVAAFFRISRTAGLLLIPYWLWVTFAVALNFSIWMLN